MGWGRREGASGNEQDRGGSGEPRQEESSQEDKEGRGRGWGRENMMAWLEGMGSATRRGAGTQGGGSGENEHVLKGETRQEERDPVH